MTDLEREHYLKRSVAEEIYSFIQLITKSPEWAEFRAARGSKGVIDFILNFIDISF